MRRLQTRAVPVYKDHNGVPRVRTRFLWTLGRNLMRQMRWGFWIGVSRPAFYLVPGAPLPTYFTLEFNFDKPYFMRALPERPQIRGFHWPAYFEVSVWNRRYSWYCWEVWFVDYRLFRWYEKRLWRRSVDEAFR